MKRFLSFIIIFALFLSLGAFSVSAVDTTVDDDTEGTGTSQNGTFWQMIVQNHIAGHDTVLDSIIQYVAGKTCGQICSVSSDGLHHCNGFDIVTEDRDGNKCYRAICSECTEYFYCYDGDFEDAYDESLTFTDDTNSANQYLVLDHIDSSGNYYFDIVGIQFSDSSISSKVTVSSFTSNYDDYSYLYYAELSSCETSLKSSSYKYNLSFILPFNGEYYLYYPVYDMSFSKLSDTYISHNYYLNFVPPSYFYVELYKGIHYGCYYSSLSDMTIVDYPIYNIGYFTSGSSYSPSGSRYIYVATHGVYGPLSASFGIQLVCTPSDSVSSPSTPADMSFNIQFTNEDNSVSVKNIQFIDITNNKYFDTTSNTWLSFDSYDYDYDNRAFTLYLDSGDIVNITYGDEYVSYVTGGNTYNYYYNSTIINEDDDDNSSDDSSGDENNNGDIIDWLKKIYNAVRGIDSGNDIDVTINNITNGEQDTDSFFDTFKLKLKWIEDVYEIAQMLLGGAAAQADAAYAYAAAVSEAESGEGSSDSVSNLATGAPSIYLNLGNANSHYGYDYGGSCVAIDFSWFAAYKPTVDGITGGFLWLLYLWGLVKNVPSILNGMGITENRIDDIGRVAYVSRMKVGKK